MGGLLRKRLRLRDPYLFKKDGQFTEEKRTANLKKKDTSSFHFSSTFICCRLPCSDTSSVLNHKKKHGVHDAVGTGNAEVFN